MAGVENVLTAEDVRVEHLPGWRQGRGSFPPKRLQEVDEQEERENRE